MNCRNARERLTADTSVALSGELVAHLEGCLECARFVERLRLADELLRHHHAVAEPDAGFASRVVAALPSSSSDLLGWAAMRLLPATLALVLVLTVWALATTPSPTSLLEQSVGEDLWTWVMDPQGSGS